jgi:RTX calcium-binding nonapeptide repeat (4 copies)
MGLKSQRRQVLTVGLHGLRRQRQLPARLLPRRSHGGRQREHSGRLASGLINGLGGADIYGGKGNDTLNGGGGNDTIARDGARDTIDCGTGRDLVYADKSDKVARNCEEVHR